MFCCGGGERVVMVARLENTLEISLAVLTPFGFGANDAQFLSLLSLYVTSRFSQSSLGDLHVAAPRDLCTFIRTG